MDDLVPINHPREMKTKTSFSGMKFMRIRKKGADVNYILIIASPFFISRLMIILIIPNSRQ